MTSESSFFSSPCQRCKKVRDWWRLDMPGTNHTMAWSTPLPTYEAYCADCYTDWEDEVDYRWNNRSRTADLEMKGKGHTITTVDGKEFYHAEWGKKRIYEKYAEYDREVHKPSLKLAQDSYRKLEQFKQKPKEIND